MNGAIFIDKRENGEVIIPFCNVAKFEVEGKLLFIWGVDKVYERFEIKNSDIASIILRAIKEGNIARLEVE